MADEQASSDVVSSEEAHPVVLVHGILGQEVLYWNVLRRRLERGGLEVHEVSLPNLALGDLRRAAMTFRVRLLELVDLLGSRHVDIVAHSAGGLVVRYYLHFLSEEAPVRRLITLGTPHGGTRTARALPGFGMLAQVRPGSEFLQELDHAPATAASRQVLYTAVWARSDAIVIPGEHARMKPAKNVENVRLSGVMHWGYLVQPRVSEFLIESLQRGFRGGEREV